MEIEKLRRERKILSLLERKERKQKRRKRIQFLSGFLRVRGVILYKKKKRTSVPPSPPLFSHQHLRSPTRALLSTWL